MLKPIDRLIALAAEDMIAVDKITNQKIQSSVDMIPQIASHLVGAGGKRLRPLLTIITADLCGYSGSAQLKLAAAVEFVHSATLLHDDIVDKSQLRRGRKPANLIWGNSAAVLVGDFLFARAFDLMVDASNMDALRVISNASSVIVNGEVNQLAALQDISMTEEEYVKIIQAKTAALFAASTEISAILANSPMGQRIALRNYGMKLGIAFQLVDDALDYGGDENSLGKAIGDDFREGKVTLPVIRAYNLANDEQRAFWHRVIVEQELDDSDLNKAIVLLRKSGALTSTLDLAREYAHGAKNGLDVFPDSEIKNTLKDLATDTLNRIN